MADSQQEGVEKSTEEGLSRGGTGKEEGMGERADIKNK